MIDHWTITNSTGVEKTLADWGIVAAKLNLVSLASDTLDLTFKGIQFDADMLFAYDSLVTLKSYDTAGTSRIWFIGRIADIPRQAQGDSEAISLTARGLWEDLEQTAYQQQWKTNGGAGTTIVSRIIMGQSIGGENASIADGVADVIAYAQSCGIAIQLGTNIKAQNIPYSEVREQTCASMIRLYVAWQPSRTSYFDYSTTPPTLHFVDRPDAPEITLPVDDAMTALQIKARPDLQVPVVAIKYLVTSTVDGASMQSTVVDRYPADISEVTRRAVVATFDLDGGSVTNTTQSQKIETRTLPLGNWTDVTWWREKLAWMKDPRVSGINIENPPEDGFNYTWGSESTSFFYAREIVAGSYQDWMSTLTSPAIHCVIGKVRTLCSFTYKEKDTDAEVKRRCQIEANVVSTNASTGTYKKTTTSVSAGQAPPTGVAQTYYESLAPLQYDGSLTIKDAEAGNYIVRPGYVLNLTGARAEWQTMRAQVQSVSLDLDSGETSITVGPAQHLGIADLMRLMQPARIQTSPRNDESRTSGKSKTANNNVDGSSAIPNDAGAAGAGVNKKMTMADKDTANQKITLDVVEGSIKIEGPENRTVIIDTSTFPSGQTASWRKKTDCNGMEFYVLATDSTLPAGG